MIQKKTIVLQNLYSLNIDNYPSILNNFIKQFQLYINIIIICYKYYTCFIVNSSNYFNK